jgi:catechol 2,3-dioxygenase
MTVPPAPPLSSAGDFGIHPTGFRMSPAMRVGPVTLDVTDVTRSTEFYRDVLGLGVLGEHEGVVSMGAAADGAELVALHEVPGATPVPRRGRLGLYHFAILLPDRGSLGRFLRHLGTRGIRPGMADHLVSEALYLHDPDGLGIEVYADRPRSSWRHRDAELVMAADPLDVARLLGAAGNTDWLESPAGTTMGHIHLSVGALDSARTFFVDGLGLDLVAWNYPGALFFSAGGYHHHVGTNIWAAGAPTAAAGDARLREWQLHVPGAADVDAVASSLETAGFVPTRDGTVDAHVTDPTGTTLRIRGQQRAAAS